jgi:hypothetical protein
MGVTQIDAGNVTRWAQTGWKRWRTANSTTINHMIYLEVQGNNYYRGFGPAPGAGSHNYQVYPMNPATGQWQALYDGSVWAGGISPPDAGWSCQTGNRADYWGEVHHPQTDMAGVPSNHCHYTNCQYLVGSFGSSCSSGSLGSPSGWQDTGLTAANVSTTDPTRWAAQWISGTAFDIWDLCPGTNT